MTKFIHTDSDLDTVIAELVKTDARFAPILAEAGRPALRRRNGGFPELAAIVVSQQLSTASASAIWEPACRCLRSVRGRCDPASGRAATGAARPVGAENPRAERNRQGGRRRRRSISMRSASREADAAHAALTAVHGIGPGRRISIFCSALATRTRGPQETSRSRKRCGWRSISKPARRQRKRLRFAESWRPWRGAAAYLLWSYYRVAKGRSGVPVIAAMQKRQQRRQPTPQENSRETEEKINGGTRRAAACAEKPEQRGSLVVFLHGYGADGNDLIDIGRAWQQSAPRCRFRIAPCAEPVRASARRPRVVRAGVPRSG